MVNQIGERDQPIQVARVRVKVQIKDVAGIAGFVSSTVKLNSLERAMDGKYVILKNKRLMTGDPMTRPFGVRIGAAELLSPDISVEVHDLKKRDLADRSREADVVAIAPAMPMKLIAPKRNFPDRIDAANAAIAWGVAAVGADTSSCTGAGIVVAVLDTGIDAAHPAFNGVELIQQDFTGEGNGDQHDHGTHCAGIVFGRNVNGQRIGIAPGIKKALIGKVLGKDGGGSSDQICNAVFWAAENGANVISMSLGMDFPGFQKELVERGFPPEVATSHALEGYRQNVLLFERLASLLKARSAMSQATIIVAAAGNESNRPEWEIAVSPPAISEGIISVGALGKTAQGFNIARFSNTGANLSAPGVDIISAKRGGGVISFSGTSMATPCVAGVAALWAEQLKKSEQLQSLSLAARLIGTSSVMGLAQGFDPLDVGAGIVRCPQ
jgi:subtilisin family serine protease